MKIKAGDTVKHIPTGETWLVCGVNYKSGDLVPCGYPFPSVAKIADCELIMSGKSGQTKEMQVALAKHWMHSFIEQEVFSDG